MADSITWTQLGSDITGDVLSDWASKSAIAVSESGNIIAIGSEKANANGIDSGQVSVYKYSIDTNSWIQLGTVINGETAGDFFGSSLSLSHDGEYLAVGSPKNQKTGQVKIYQFLNDDWEQIGKSIYGESNEDLFGSSVSLSENGSILAVGGQLNDGNGINSGHVRVFQNSENNWIQIGQDIDGEFSGDLSGSSISISGDGNLIAIGGRKNDGINGVNSGHVRIFYYDSENLLWKQLGNDIDGGSGGDLFGHYVSISSDGRSVAIGSPVSNSYKGETKVYSYDDKTSLWNPLGQSILGENYDSWSGYTVALSGDGKSLIIGDYSTTSWNTGIGAQSRIFTFDESTSLWSQQGQTLGGNGYSIGFSDDGSFVGIIEGGTLKLYKNGENPPKISGPSGNPGEATSYEHLNENITSVFQFKSNESSTWYLTGGEDKDLFEIDKNSGNLIFKNSPDYENPQDSSGDNIYKVEITSTDLIGNSSKQEINITILNVVEINDPESNHIIYLDENITEVHQFSADIEATWSLKGGEDISKFSIGENSGILSFINPPDWELPSDNDADNEYEVTISAKDSSSNESDLNLLINVLDVDDTPPEIYGPSGSGIDENELISVDENSIRYIEFSSSEQVKWSLQNGDDDSLFEIDQEQGILNFKNSPDYENPQDLNKDNIYKVGIRATDLAGNISEQIVSVLVGDVDDTPASIIGPSGIGGDISNEISISENTTFVYDYSATEDVTWSLNSGDDIDFFEIDSEEGILNFKNPPDFENPEDLNEDNIYNLGVKATDLAGNISDQILSVNVGDVDDTPASIIGPSGIGGNSSNQINISENTTFVYDYSATEDVTWSLSNGDDDSLFEIDQEQGILNFKNPPDYENPQDLNKDNIYNVGLKATDFAGNISNQLLDIYLVNAIEIDESSNENNQLFIYENNTYVHKFIADEVVTWSLGNYKDENLFTIDNKNGELNFKFAPDYENPSDMNSDGIYNVEIVATNKNQISTNQIFNIKVLDIDEPIFSISSEFSGTIKEGQEILALVSTKFIPANTTIFWNLSGSNIDSNDISDGKLSGELKLDKNGTSNLDLIFLNDDVVEGTEIAELNIFSDAKMNNRITGSAFISIMDLPVKQHVADPKTGNIFGYQSEKLYSLPYLCDFQGLLQAGFDNEEAIGSYKFHKELDINGDGIEETIFTNRISGRWASASVDPITGDIDFTKYGSDGVTRIVGRYDDPLVPDFGSLNFFLEDGITLSPVSSADDPNRFVDLNNNNIFEDNEDRLKLNSQIRLNNDLAIDNLIPKKAGDFDGDGFQEIYWKTFDETCYMRAVMHADGNIQYANYQSESQMREYLTTNGNADSINEII